MGQKSIATAQQVLQAHEDDVVGGDLLLNLVGKQQLITLCAVKVLDPMLSRSRNQLIWQGQK
jgi:hypothetical protein